MEYLIRFAQAHETFRQPEIEALAALAGIEVKFVIYDHYVGVLLFEFFAILFFYDDLFFFSPHYLSCLFCPKNCLSCGNSSVLPAAF